MMSAEEAQARMLASAEMVRSILPRLRDELGEGGARYELAMQRRRELLDNEPAHLRRDQLLELYCIELIEALKTYRSATGLQ